MFNPVAFDPEYDRELLEGSFHALRYRKQLEIIIDMEACELVRKKIASGMTLPEDASLSIQNLFRFILPQGKFYIAQCLFDFGYNTSSKTQDFSDHRYEFQVVGLAQTKVDLGNTIMRAETKADKIIGRFFGNDIDFEGTTLFNEKYYLVSDKKEALDDIFDKSFFETIGQYDDLLLHVRHNELFITFDNDFDIQHSRIIEDILAHCNFLEC